MKQNCCSLLVGMTAVRMCHMKALLFGTVCLWTALVVGTLSAQPQPGNISPASHEVLEELDRSAAARDRPPPAFHPGCQQLPDRWAALHRQFLPLAERKRPATGRELIR